VIPDAARALVGLFLLSLEHAGRLGAIREDCPLRANSAQQRCYSFCWLSLMDAFLGCVAKYRIGPRIGRITIASTQPTSSTAEYWVLRRTSTTSAVKANAATPIARQAEITSKATGVSGFSWFMKFLPS
jgi:hypothetical protein